MKKNFFRKVGFGIGPDEMVPEYPVSWAQNQVDKVPPLIWDTEIRSGEEMLNHYAEWVYTDREILRKKYKENRQAYKEAKNKFMDEVTVEGAELAIEVGKKLKQDLNEKDFPLMFSVIECICENKKLEISW